jgi:chemotaxis protein methyltransferase CheR
MSGSSCAEFLQWALPRLGLAWPGYRRVKRQVCRRIARRLAALGIADCAAYRHFLEQHPEEWPLVEAATRVSISRFFRDRDVFAALEADVLPALADAAATRGDEALRAWSAGCASGEEPYSLSILWRMGVAARFPRLDLAILATDADEVLLARAAAAIYATGSLREVPAAWRAAAFLPRNGEWVLREAFRTAVELRLHDIRRGTPPGPFDLVLCRNLAFTYFDERGQEAVLKRLEAALHPAGVLVIGAKEQLPGGHGLTPIGRGIYRRAGMISAPSARTSA